LGDGGNGLGRDWELACGFSIHPFAPANLKLDRGLATIANRYLPLLLDLGSAAVNKQFNTRDET
jgi:hypothetical protein